jgi:hypothetical protein
MLVGKARTYPVEEPLIALLKVKLIALHANNTLGWKGLTGTNTLV